jgi:hypothetical protein
MSTLLAMIGVAPAQLELVAVSQMNQTCAAKFEASKKPVPVSVTVLPPVMLPPGTPPDSAVPEIPVTVGVTVV